MADMIQIAEKLVERTNENRIPWKPTINPNSFSAMIGDLSVMVSLQSNGGVFGSSTTLAIFDEKGTELDSLQDREGNRYPILPSLHRAARRSAQGVEKRLDELLAKLSEDAA